MRSTCPERLCHEEPLAVRRADLFAQLVHGERGELGVEARAAAADLKRTDGLLAKIEKVYGDRLEKEMATHSSILTWRIPWTEEPGGLQSMGLQSVRHD